jgi:hypothetical protein
MPPNNSNNGSIFLTSLLDILLMDIHDEGDDLRLCVSDFLKVMTAVNMTSILISSLTSFAPIARKFMCCSSRLSLCVQN